MNAQTSLSALHTTQNKHKNTVLQSNIKTKKRQFFPYLNNAFRDGSLYVLAILKIYENIYEIQQNEIFNKNWIHSQQ